MSRRIYLASSWRNPYYENVLRLLRDLGHEVYDFRVPRSGGPVSDETPEKGFAWTETDSTWGTITPDILDRYKAMLAHPVAKRGFESDYAAMRWADTCVLLLPCGRSAHLEAGWMVGSGRLLLVFMPPAVEQTDGETKLAWSFEPELMYLLGGDARIICTSEDELAENLKEPPQ